MRNAVVLFVGACAAIVAASVGAGSAAAACSAGVHPYGGVTARTFCGPAKATVTVGGKTFAFSGGSCERGAAYLTVNIGTVVLGTTSKPKPEYFGLTVGKVPMLGGVPAKTDGTYTPQALTAAHAGKGYAILSAKVTLKGNRSKGTFTGTVFGTSGKVTGSFGC
jgi:hypothetical protein